ncbi:hypothetical protein B0H17DRAFT_1140643 [Mycena rosella]|uniref:Uncharacterized protein n=1 Tax=Mycena rosella TaxID=1033263 RepID=A0AAD7G772_MYCRO|nr:hypothetical protein B0H17DRAFT_1140643 [Mycena rosella]
MATQYLDGIDRHELDTKPNIARPGSGHTRLDQCAFKLSLNIVWETELGQSTKMEVRDSMMWLSGVQSCLVNEQTKLGQNKRLNTGTKGDKTLPVKAQDSTHAIQDGLKNLISCSPDYFSNR